MAKEFDIYLRDRVRHCDIFVYSITFRKKIGVDEELILENCLESYKLYKSLSVDLDSELSSHIDNMMKICYERINNGATINVEAHLTGNIPTSVRENMSLDSELRATIARYRKLSEFDNLTLADLDDMSLLQLDFVITDD